MKTNVMLLLPTLTLLAGVAQAGQEYIGVATGQVWRVDDHSVLGEFSPVVTEGDRFEFTFLFSEANAVADDHLLAYHVTGGTIEVGLLTSVTGPNDWGFQLYDDYPGIQDAVWASSDLLYGGSTYSVSLHLIDSTMTALDEAFLPAVIPVDGFDYNRFRIARVILGIEPVELVVGRVETLTIQVVPEPGTSC